MKKIIYIAMMSIVILIGIGFVVYKMQPPKCNNDQVYRILNDLKSKEEMKLSLIAQKKVNLVIENIKEISHDIFSPQRECKFELKIKDKNSTFSSPTFSIIQEPGFKKEFRVQIHNFYDEK